MSSTGPSPRRRWPWLLVPSTLLALGLAEGVARVASPPPGPPQAPFGEGQHGYLHQRSATPGLRYEMIPDHELVYQGVPVRTNSLGMRDAEPIAPRPPGLLRLAALGDSVTFGWGVQGGETWPDVLERLLAATAPCEVLNFGVAGYSTADECVALERKALPLAPDGVVVGYFLNDPQSEQVSPLHTYFREPRLWERSRLWTLWTRARRKSEMRALGGGNYYRWYHATAGEQWQGECAALERLAAAARGAGVPVLVAIFPTWFGYPTLADYPYADLHDQVAAEVRRHGMEALDLLPVYRASGLAVAELRADDEHPNARGHALAAEAIRARIRELGWTPRLR